VPFHNRTIGNLMVYKDRLETTAAEPDPGAPEPAIFGGARAGAAFKICF